MYRRARGISLWVRSRLNIPGLALLSCVAQGKSVHFSAPLDIVKCRRGTYLSGY